MNTIRILALMVSVVLSTGLVCLYKRYSEWNTELFLFFGPGIVFAAYIVFLRVKKMPWHRSLIYFLTLVFTYFLMVAISIASWGVAVAPAGALGACVVKCMIEERIKIRDKKMLWFALMGSVSAMAGWLLLIYMPNATIENDGVIAAPMIFLWQLLIGIAVLIHYSKKKDPLTSLEDSPLS